MLMKRIFKPKLSLLLTGFLIIAVIAIPFVVNSINSHHVSAANAVTLPGAPAGFTKTQLANGLKKPTVFAFAPNGDIYIGEQIGVILIYRNGAVLPNPVVTLNTDSAAEKGLLGLALDPNFATNGYMYVSYTTVDEHALLSRLTVQNDTASLLTEKIYMKGNQLQNPHHSANDLRVGPDG